MYTFRDLKAKIYNCTKKSHWHLAIWQNWCFGQSYRSKIEKLTLSLSQFLRCITWFKSQDLPFNGENVAMSPLGTFHIFIGKSDFTSELLVKTLIAHRKILKLHWKKDNVRLNQNVVVFSIAQKEDVFWFFQPKTETSCRLKARLCSKMSSIASPNF